MAPNSDNTKLRQRFANDDADLDDSAYPATQSTILLKNIKGTEAVIDGTIYDLTSFKHPGGDVFMMFGGNDVSVHYKMIHPYHTSKHLEKMKAVGKVKDGDSDYIFDTEFEREIKREVFKIVPRGREFATNGFFFRVFFYIMLHCGLDYLWTTQVTSLKMAIAFGVSQALIALNIQHDANHGAISKKAWVNDLFGFSVDAIGSCKWNWMSQHWTHHAFTNHKVKDPDSFAAEPVVLFNDYPLGHQARKVYHKFQVIFFLPIQSLYWLSVVTSPETFTLRHSGTESVGIRMDNDFLKSRRVWAALIRFTYLYVNIFRPILNGIAASGIKSVFTTIFHIFIMGAATSLTLGGLAALSHNFEHADRDPTKDRRENGKAVCWFKSQVETSATYGGFISGVLTGGLNFQVEHHLFPRMSSAWYPYIAPKVREICKKHGVRYAYYPWVWQNLISTFKYMHAAGTGNNWKEDMAPLKGDL